MDSGQDRTIVAQHDVLRFGSRHAGVLVDRARAVDGARVRSSKPKVGDAWRPAPHFPTARRVYRFDVIVPPFDWDSWAEILEGIRVARGEIGRSIVVRPLKRAAHGVVVPVRPDELVDQTDGVFAVRLNLTAELLNWLTALNRPVVLAEAEHPAFSSVAVDHEAAASVGVRHLLTLGHHRIALVDVDEDSNWIRGQSRARRRGYRTTLREAGVGYLEYQASAGECAASANSIVDAWLSSPTCPTAVFCGSDRLAAAISQAAREREMAVPADLAVVGYGDGPLAEYLGLTTVRLPMTALGRGVVDCLLDELRGSCCEPVHTRLSGELVIRRTSGAAVFPTAEQRAARNIR
jgi:DNA-binding LacI/PurR family transcriptional regulator